MAANSSIQLAFSDKLAWDWYKRVIYLSQVIKWLTLNSGCSNFQCVLNREGFRKKNWEKVWSFAKPPLAPPPGYGLFFGTKIAPHFFLEIIPLLGETNFTLGPI